MNHQSLKPQESSAARSRRDKLCGLAAGAALFLTGSVALGHAGAGTGHLQTSDYSVDVKNLENAPVQVHSVDGPAHDPFYIGLDPATRSLAQFQVPSDKRLILTFLSARAAGGSTIEDMYIESYSGGKPASAFIPMNTTEGDFRYAVQQMQMECDAGTTVYVAVDDSNSEDTTTVTTCLQGYYVDKAGTILSNGF
jgi:hypothetical protein